MPPDRVTVLEWNFLPAKSMIERNAKAKLYSAANILRNEWLSVLTESSPRTGRYYYVPGTRTQYRASAPKEPPAVRTGRMLRSIKVDIDEAHGIARVGSPLEYVLILEVWKDRPSLRPAWERALPKMVQDLHNWEVQGF